MARVFVRLRAQGARLARCASGRKKPMLEESQTVRCKMLTPLQTSRGSSYLVRLFALPLPRPTVKTPSANHFHAPVPPVPNESTTNPNTAHGNLIRPGGQAPPADRVSGTSPARAERRVCPPLSPVWHFKRMGKPSSCQSTRPLSPLVAWHVPLSPFWERERMQDGVRRGGSRRGGTGALGAELRRNGAWANTKCGC